MTSLNSKNKLEVLRGLMRERKIDAYVVPSEDAHASEYLAPCDARRAFITSFTGSAGCAVITLEEARCWTDGRYWLQAAKQLGEGWTLMKSGLPDVPNWGQWLKTGLAPSSRIGIDPRLMPFAESVTLSASLVSPSQGSAANSGSLASTFNNSYFVPIKENLIDLMWDDQPARPANPIFHLADEYTGEPVLQKLGALREKLVKSGSPGMVVGALDEIAWLFNLRGSDIPYNPVFFAYAIVTPHDCTLFLHPSSLTPEVREYLHQSKVAILEYEHVWNALESWGELLKEKRKGGPVKTEEVKEEEGKEKIVKTDKVLIGMKTSWAIAKAVGEDNVEVRRSMVEDAKAKKNATEIEGFRQSHIRDGMALVRYFAWLEEVLGKGEVWTEYDAAEILEGYRRENKWFKGLSFETISSSGANAAVIHYAPPKVGSAVIDRNQMYLCDSGAQYLDGTTDVTRTLHFGTPSNDEKRSFTRVVSVIQRQRTPVDRDVAAARAHCSGYRRLSTGNHCDILARRPLWSDGLDYRHSTSHGVGAFLNVHEGPHGVGQRTGYNETALQAGMVMSNEPGFYLDGQYGIRIENIVVIKMAETKWNFGKKGFLELEHVTMCPIQTKLVDLQLLIPAEKEWLNSYHREIEEKLGPLLRDVGDERALRWLADACKAI
ncbi:Xaa-Pro aminopeptidase, partial [Tremellales sp. Uapishka_1]